MKVVFSILSSLISIYAFLCFVRIILTWIPQAAYSKVTQFLAKICDPFLNIFSKIKFLQIGGFDFGPAVGLCVLGALASLLGSFTHNARFSVGSILALIIDLIFSLVSSVLGFIIIVIFIRLMIYIFRHEEGPGHSGNVLLNAIDNSLSPMLYRITKTFARRTVSYKAAMITGIVVFVVILVVTAVFFTTLALLVSAF